jgi:hypothetical protein
MRFRKIINLDLMRFIFLPDPVFPNVGPDFFQRSGPSVSDQNGLDLPKLREHNDEKLLFFKNVLAD